MVEEASEGTKYIFLYSMTTLQVNTLYYSLLCMDVTQSMEYG